VILGDAQTGLRAAASSPIDTYHFKEHNNSHKISQCTSSNLPTITARRKGTWNISRGGQTKAKLWDGKRVLLSLTSQLNKAQKAPALTKQ